MLAFHVTSVIALVAAAHASPFIVNREEPPPSKTMSTTSCVWSYGQPVGPATSVVTGPHPPITAIPTAVTSTASCMPIQYDFPAGTNSDTSKADAVKAFYQTVWNDYAEHCFGKDEINVLNNTCLENLFGWGASIVDGIDTAIIMNLTDIVKQQLQFISQIDFTKPYNPSNPNNADGFDSTIRYIGGLLASYDLLTSGYVPIGTYDQDLVNSLLSQAVVLADKLQVQFDTPTGLPTPNVNFLLNQANYSTFVDPLNNETYNVTDTAVAGTIILEYYKLSDLTGDEKYRHAADVAESYLINPYPAPAFPFLVGSNVDTNTGNFLTYDFGWEAGIDSFLEYLIKTYIYNPNAPTSSAHLQFWAGAVQSSIEHIALSPQSFPQLTYLSQADAAGNIMWEMDDYACFAGGNILYGGKFLNNPAFMDLGLRVTDSCHHLYNTTTSGLGMEMWGWFNETGGTYNQSYMTNQTLIEEAKENGYFIINSDYSAYPESIESIWYSYRITGDQRWQDYNWEIFQALEREHNASFPYADISDVNQPDTGFLEELPSFFFAEVMKYLYLSFTPPDIISLDKWVLNTEAHPLLRNASCGAGGGTTTTANTAWMPATAPASINPGSASWTSAPAKATNWQPVAE